MENKTHRFNLMVSPAFKQRLDAAAKILGVKSAELMRAATEKEIAKIEKRKS